MSTFAMGKQSKPDFVSPWDVVVQCSTYCTRDVVVQFRMYSTRRNTWTARQTRARDARPVRESAGMHCWQEDFALFTAETRLYSRTPSNVVYPTHKSLTYHVNEPFCKKRSQDLCTHTYARTQDSFFLSHALSLFSSLLVFFLLLSLPQFNTAIQWLTSTRLAINLLLYFYFYKPKVCFLDIILHCPWFMLLSTIALLQVSIKKKKHTKKNNNNKGSWGEQEVVPSVRNCTTFLFSVYFNSALFKSQTGYVNTKRRRCYPTQLCLLMISQLHSTPPC